MVNKMLHVARHRVAYNATSFALIWVGSRNIFFGGGQIPSEDQTSTMTEDYVEKIDEKHPTKSIYGCEHLHALPAKDNLDYILQLGVTIFGSLQEQHMCH